MSRLDKQLKDSIAEHSWLHFTQMSKVMDRKPGAIVRGEGVRIQDDEGNEYIDMLAGLYCVNIGYGRKEVNEAIYAQLQEINYVNPFYSTNIPAIRLADKLAELTFGEGTRVFFVNSGSEAVETTLKIAKQYQLNAGFPRRYKTISRRSAYHGTTMGALSVNGLREIREPFGPLVPGAGHIVPAYCYRCPFDMKYPECGIQCARDLDRLISFEGPESIAAVIMEPVQNSGGALVPPDEYLPLIREKCTEHGILLIADEVLTGFGRTGQWFGYQNWDYEPDIMSCAKGITSAYLPLGAAIAKKEVADAFMGDDKNAFQHASTFGGHPVVCAAALANIEIMEREDLPGNAARMGAYLTEQLHQGLDTHPSVGDIRGRGLHIAIELVRDKPTREKFAEDAIPDTDWLRRAFMERGVIVSASTRIDPVIELSPPLNIGKDDINTAVAVIEEVITAFEQNMGMVGKPVSVS